MQPSVSSLLKQDQARLAQALGLPDAEARLEAQILLCQALGATRAWLLAHTADQPNPAQIGRYQALLKRRFAGEPVAYILGKREFYGLEFKVTPAVLIPRPETELLVDLALARIPQDASCRVLDLGTGSGAVAVAIASHRPQAKITAVDRSPEALDVARENVKKLETENVRLLQSDWFDALAGEKFDLIVSNPPYVAAADPHLQQGDLRFEPAAALASGTDGLDAIRKIVAGAPVHLESGGWLLFEHGYDQGERCRELMAQGGFREISTTDDLAGIPRVTCGRI